MYRNALVIGATGMMTGVAEYLAKKSQSFLFTARTSQSVDDLSARLDPIVCVFGAKLDWNVRTEFISGLVELCENGEFPDIVVAWLHDDTLGPEIAAGIARGQNVDFYQVRGSSAANPTEADSLEIPDIEGLIYHEVILGFQVEDSRSRWLTNDEICGGIIHAIDNGLENSVVGVVEPWEMHP